MKKLIMALVGVVVLLLVVAMVVPTLVPVEKYKEEGIAQVKAATGRDFRIEGDVGFSLFPVLGFSAEKVALGNVAGAAAPDMVSLEKLQVKVKLLPLISGEIAVDSFVLVKPVISLEIDKNGKPNWEFPAAAADPAAKSSNQPAASTPASGDAGAPALQQVRLGDIRIDQGQFAFIDHKAGSKQQIQDLNLKLKLPSLDEPLELDGDLVWQGQKINLDANVDALRQVLAAKPAKVVLNVAADPVKLEVSGEFTNGKLVQFTGPVKLDVPSVRALVAWTTGKPLEMAGSGLGPLNIAGTLGLNGPKISFNGASLNLDAIKSTGDFAVDTSGKVPAISAKMNVEKLDVNPYLPPEQAGSGEGAAAASGSSGSGGAKTQAQGWSDDPIDLSGLKAVNADLNLTVGGIVFQKIQIGKGNVVVKLNNGRANVNLTELALYQGNGQGTIVLDGSGATPGVEANFKLAGIQAQPLLKDAADFERLAGAGATDIAIKTVGKSQKAMVSALNGKGGFKFTDGAIVGINLAQMVRNVTGAFDGTAGQTQKTDFSELAATYTITNGILTNKDLAMKSPLIRVEGAGTVNLPAQSVDYKISPKAVATVEGQGGKDAAGIMVPVIVSGPWSNLSYRPDLEGLLKSNLDPSKAVDAVKGAAGDLAKQPGEALKGLTGGGAGTSGSSPIPDPGKAIKGLFGN